MFKLIKKIIKACLPYGIIYLSRKINKHLNRQKNLKNIMIQIRVIYMPIHILKN
jgi:hypothetical protein